MKDRKLAPFGPKLEGGRRFGGVFHPHGNWIAYQDLEPSGPPTVFIEPFPATVTKNQVDWGNHALWTTDGKQLIVSSEPRTFRLYNVSTTPRVEITEAGRFDRGQSITPPVGPRQFDFSRDGQLLVVLPATDTTAAPTRELHVVLNWFEELKKK
jgi:WD40 repeat protein